MIVDVELRSLIAISPNNFLYLSVFGENAHTKINKSAVVLGVNEDIFRFDIEVNDTVLMNDFQGKKNANNDKF